MKRLVTSGIEVKAMVMPRDPQAAKPAAFPNVQIVEADLGDQDSINVACESGRALLRLQERSRKSHWQLFRDQPSRSRV